MVSKAETAAATHYLQFNIQWASLANNLLSILMVVFEFSSAILTFARSVQTFRTAGPWRAHRSGLIFLIFRQGALYFGIISLFTTAAVILNFRAPAGFLQRLLNAFTLPLSGLLTARFLLHMRKWENRHSHSDTVNDASQAGTLGGFRAARAPGTLSTIIEDFGEDPVGAARARGSSSGSGSGSSGV
ncbi:hypothetical protein PQX77_011128 [Marasmius sp. AFHP31]|nr:hypothetical protein PQX77_011128 [Marasmius sp. AFHP31]